MGKLQFGHKFLVKFKWENCNLVTSFLSCL
nr:hypothetical protein pmam_243 [Pithovirus mammoth]